MAVTLIFKNKERRPYGSGANGRMIPAESGRRAIYVPSFGALEKDEVDYLVEAAQEQEDERVKKDRPSANREMVDRATQLAQSVPEGQRAKAVREAMKEVQ